ncbi:MAG: crossover junction endodeoxyribonuclease RuvC [Dehalococcoidia bacterium]|nr:crossover junction endodeoxyribonuclease RuvC [Dehalococcoidia bacterium]
MSGLQPLVLGIDPGLRVCGWGIVRGAQRPEYVAGGVIRPKAGDSIGRRLLQLNQEIAGVIQTYGPDEVAIEEQFVGALNPTSALAIGQARAAAVIAAAAHGLDVGFYAPAAVKAAVSGYGQGDKQQVQAMVKLLLGLDAVPEPADAADALAVALCHLGMRRAKALTAASATNGPTGKRWKAPGTVSNRQP